MSLDIVGKENLPNIYIKEASIEELDDYSIIVNTMVYLKDIKVNTRLQWYDNENLRKSMKIFVVVSSSKVFNEAVESGGYTGGFTPKYLNKIPGYDSGFVDYKIVSIQNTDRRKLVESGEPVTGGTLYTLGYQCRFTPKRTSNIAVFAVCMLDTEQFAKEEDLDLSHPLINTFYGAVAGEYIIKNNQVQYSTYLFFKGDTLWTGPVYRAKSKWYAGSKPSSTPAQELSIQTIPNTKIKDYRMSFQKKPRVLRAEAKKTAMFSKIYSSFNARGNLTGAFYFNMKQFFIQKTRYGGLLLQLNQETFDAMMTKTKIKRFDIYREQILLTHTTNAIGTSQPSASKVFNNKLLISSHDERPYTLKTRYRYYSSKNSKDRFLYNRIRGIQARTETLKSSLKEVNVENTIETRAFVFSDLVSDYTSLGHFRYSVSMEFNDPTYDYVREMLGELKAAYARFKTYKRQIEKTMYYDYNLHKTKELYVQTNKSEEWMSFINTYLKYYDLLFDADETAVRLMGSQIISLINPRSATTKSLDRFAQHYSFLLSYFMDFFGQTNKLFNDPNSRGNVKVNSNRGKIQVEKTFAEVHTFSQNQRRMSFLPDELSVGENLENFPVVSKGAFRKVGSGERDKYFRATVGFTESYIPALTANQVAAMNEITNYSSVFLSPRKLHNKEESFNVSKLETINITDFNHFYTGFSSFKNPSYNHFSDTSSKQVALANRYFSSFYIRKPSAIQKNEQEQENYASELVLGGESSFPPSRQETNTIQNTVLDTGISNMFRSYESSHGSDHNITSQFYVLDGSSNIITSLINSPSFSNATLQRVPLQVKSLLGSPYNFSRTNILNSNADLLTSSKTRDLVHTLFFTIVKIEYLERFERTTDEELDFNRPRWSLLTNNALATLPPVTLCRMSYYANESLKIMTPTLNCCNIENTHFYLGKGSVRDDLSTINPLPVAKQSLLPAALSDITEANRYPIEYTRSMIVLQTNEKNGPLRSLDYGVQAQTSPITPSLRIGSTAPGGRNEY